MTTLTAQPFSMKATLYIMFAFCIPSGRARAQWAQAKICLEHGDPTACLSFLSHPEFNASLINRPTSFTLRPQPTLLSPQALPAPQGSSSPVAPTVPGLKLKLGNALDFAIELDQSDLAMSLIAAGGCVGHQHYFDASVPLSLCALHHAIHLESIQTAEDIARTYPAMLLAPTLPIFFGELDCLPLTHAVSRRLIALVTPLIEAMANLATKEPKCAPAILAEFQKARGCARDDVLEAFDLALARAGIPANLPGRLLSSIMDHTYPSHNQPPLTILFPATEMEKLKERMLALETEIQMARSQPGLFRAPTRPTTPRPIATPPLRDR